MAVELVFDWPWFWHAMAWTCAYLVGRLGMYAVYATWLVLQPMIVLWHGRRVLSLADELRLACMFDMAVRRLRP